MKLSELNEFQNNNIGISISEIFYAYTFQMGAKDNNIGIIISETSWDIFYVYSF